MDQFKYFLYANFYGEFGQIILKEHCLTFSVIIGSVAIFPEKTKTLSQRAGINNQLRQLFIYAKYSNSSVDLINHEKILVNLQFINASQIR